MTLAKEILARIPERPVQLVTVTCATTGPFTVYIDGDTDNVPAVIMAGSTFGLGDEGYAFWRSGAKPICFKTT